MVFDFFEEHSRLSWFVVIVGAIGIFIISSLQFGAGGGGTRLLPILYHIFAFFFLGLFLLIALIKGEKRYLLFLIGIVLAVGYGITDEIHQFFVPGRYCSFLDILTDSIGIFCSGIIYSIRLRIKR